MLENFLIRIRQASSSRRYRFTRHAEAEREADQLSMRDILETLVSATCEVVEHYPNDPRGESALLLGFMRNGAPLHIV